MRRIGEGGEMAGRVVAIVRDDARFADVLLEERKTGLILYRLVEPQGRPTWDAYYRPWARITLRDPATSAFDLEYMRYTRKWQRLDFVGLLEDCVHEIARDRAGVFFPPGGD
jgi:hypothetical protein